MGPTLLQSLEEKDKHKRIKIGLKIYVLKCTLYVCRNVHLGFFCKVFLTLLGRHQLKVSTPSPFPPRNL